MLKPIYATNDKKKNKHLVILIVGGLSDLKKEIKNMSEKEKEIEKPNEMVNIVEEIIDFNDRT